VQERKRNNKKKVVRGENETRTAEIGRMMEYVAGRIRERQICTVTRGKRERERESGKSGTTEGILKSYPTPYRCTRRATSEGKVKTDGQIQM
jgi:hypothetical protein